MRCVRSLGYRGMRNCSFSRRLGLPAVDLAICRQVTSRRERVGERWNGDRDLVTSVKAHRGMSGPFTFCSVHSYVSLSL